MDWLTELTCRLCLLRLGTRRQSVKTGRKGLNLKAIFNNIAVYFERVKIAKKPSRAWFVTSP